MRANPTDPTHLYYSNRDTSVSTGLLLSPALTAALVPVNEDVDGEAESPGACRFSEEAPPGDDGDEDEEDHVEIETAPVTMSIPLLVPAFFAREAIGFAAQLASRAGLRLLHHEHDSPEQPEADAVPEPAAILASWESARREAVRAVLEQGGWIRMQMSCCETVAAPLGVWGVEKAEAWWRYGLVRSNLASEFASGSFSLPLLQAAYHGDTVKTLCEWQAGTAAVLPRTDLVLVRRRREKKGLLRTREVIEEGIADGATVWKLLAPHATVRTEPVELLVVREGAASAVAVAEAILDLPLEPLENVRRASLVGVVDLDLDALRDEAG